MGGEKTRRKRRGRSMRRQRRRSGSRKRPRMHRKEAEGTRGIFLLQHRPAARFIGDDENEEKAEKQEKQKSA